MKKITAIIAVSATVTLLAFAGCQKKEEAPKPVEQSTMTSTVTATAPTPAATPEKK